MPRATFGTAFGIALFLLLEALLFRSGIYVPYIEPESNAGKVTYHLLWFSQFRPPAAWKEIAVIGDSRIAEGFSGKIASEAPGPAQNYFWCFGLHGTTPRIWHYFFRDADPRRNHFAAIVLTLDRYSDEDRHDSPTDRLLDLNYVVNQLRYSDAWEFSRSLTSPDRQRDALAGSLLKGWTLRRDVRDFLQNVPERLKISEQSRNRGYGFEWGYDGVSASLRGLSYDPAQRAFHFPPGLTASQQFTIGETVTPQFAAPHGDTTRYRTYWFGKILDFYRGSKTKLIFVQLPRAPLTPVTPPFPSTFIDSLRGKANVTVIPAETFEDLEAPDYFFDGLHMNHTGRKIFSERIAQLVDRELRSE